ncbi:MULTISPECIES: LysR family transcriptional regulator [Rhodobacterales]|uniref:LysR family transcriptional regulator n=1 Tax=Roseobacter sp. N2S TaxID=2663844 RepID=UPI00285EAE68|nr:MULTISPECIES: LysR family transcriptional regulator [Rhodobacterales]MDR6265449.1 DNA-binding transcriptional LysR family regulator [Roseobacter sp. N2S]
MENWDDLRFAVALARYGSMSKAARHLRTNTATVSRRIRRLNEAANAVLFRKSASEWELTSEGRRLFEMAASFSDELQTFNAATANAQQSHQIIRVSGLEFLINEVLSKTLPDFCEQHPNVTLELSANNKKVSLAYGEADIALRLTRPTEGRLVARRIANIRMGVFATSDTKSQDWIGLPFDLDWTPEMKNGLSYFNCEPTLRLASFRSIYCAMRETGRPGILPEIMMQTTNDLMPLQPQREMRLRELWLLFHESRKEDAVLRSTTKWLEESFATIGC